MEKTSGRACTETLFVSLSGGVDSMVLAECLIMWMRQRHGSLVRRADGDSAPAPATDTAADAGAGTGAGAGVDARPRRRVVALHVNFTNRSRVSFREAEFVERWCQQKGIGA